VHAENFPDCLSVTLSAPPLVVSEPPVSSCSPSLRAQRSNLLIMLNRLQIASSPPSRRCRIDQRLLKSFPLPLLLTVVGAAPADKSAPAATVPTRGRLPRSTFIRSSRSRHAAAICLAMHCMVDIHLGLHRETIHRYTPDREQPSRPATSPGICATPACAITSASLTGVF